MVCTICETEFEAKRQAKYCSKSCRDKAAYGKRTCDRCSAEFYGRGKDQRFCSRSCSSRAHVPLGLDEKVGKGEKLCTVCLTIKPNTAEFFNRHAKHKDGLSYRCRRCNSEHLKRDYANNTDRYLANARKRNKEYNIEKFKFIVKFLRDNPCVDCGEADLIVLEFDHLRDKKYTISTLLGSGHSMGLLKREIAKCEVVCANCHRRRTAKRGNWRKYQLSVAQFG